MGRLRLTSGHACMCAGMCNGVMARPASSLCWPKPPRCWMGTCPRRSFWARPRRQQMWCGSKACSPRQGCPSLPPWRFYAMHPALKPLFKVVCIQCAYSAWLGERLGGACHEASQTEQQHQSCLLTHLIWYLPCTTFNFAHFCWWHLVCEALRQSKQCMQHSMLGDAMAEIPQMQPHTVLSACYCRCSAF